MSAPGWSRQQADPLAAIAEWLRRPTRQILRLFGYVGTGKTTLARYAVAASRAPIFTAFTGKAAAVLRRKGCPGARNIHQFLYRALNGDDEADQDAISVTTEEIPEPDHAERRGGLAFELEPRDEILAASVVVIDEASMVSGTVLSDLLSLDKPVLSLGDPAQPPPVGEGCGALAAGEPDVFLTEIHRQALDNPIIRLSMLAREAQPLPHGVHGDSYVLSLSLDKICRSRADQILCGTHRTCRLINRQVRQNRDCSGWLPEIGERLVCLRNQHGLGLLNGTIWVVRKVITGRQMVGFELEPEEGGHCVPFNTPTEDFYVYFDFGDCFNVDKAQGSEWGSVLLVDESFCFRDEAPRWLYTGITRAAKRVAVVRRVR